MMSRNAKDWTANSARSRALPNACPSSRPGSMARWSRCSPTAAPAFKRCRTHSRETMQPPAILCVRSALPERLRSARGAARGAQALAGAAARQRAGQCSVQCSRRKVWVPSSSRSLQPRIGRNCLQARRSALSLRPRPDLAQGAVLSAPGAGHRRLHRSRRVQKPGLARCSSACTSLAAHCAIRARWAPASTRRPWQACVPASMSSCKPSRLSSTRPGCGGATRPLGEARIGGRGRLHRVDARRHVAPPDFPGLARGQAGRRGGPGTPVVAVDTPRKPSRHATLPRANTAKAQATRSRKPTPDSARDPSPESSSRTRTSCSTRKQASPSAI